MALLIMIPEINMKVRHSGLNTSDMPEVLTIRIPDNLFSDKIVMCIREPHVNGLEIFMKTPFRADAT